MFKQFFLNNGGIIFFNGPNLLLIKIQKQARKKNFMNVLQKLPFLDLPICRSEIFQKKFFENFHFSPYLRNFSMKKVSQPPNEIGKEGLRSSLLYPIDTSS